MAAGTRQVDQLLARYGEFHRNRANKTIHWFCVPLIMWSLLGMLWAASPVAALIAVAAALVYYVTLSPILALGMSAVAAVMIYALTLLGRVVLPVSICIFVAAWAGQFIGHTIEGRKPAFLDDVRSFLVAPVWLLGDLLRRLKIRY
jgi:uncharacterized membrane protein YGL010W